MHPALSLAIVVDTLELEPAVLRDGWATSIPLGPAEALALGVGGLACSLRTAGLSIPLARAYRSRNATSAAAWCCALDGREGWPQNRER